MNCSKCGKPILSAPGRMCGACDREYPAAIHRIADHYGIDAQTIQTGGECGELLSALCDYRRGRATLDDICGAIADVRIMCDQMAYLHGIGDAEIREKMIVKVNREIGSIEDVG